MRFKIAFFLSLLILVVFSKATTAAQVTDQEVAYLVERINGVEKIDQLYSIRYAVGKYAARPDLTLRQQEILMKAMLLLTDEFKFRSHYRNAVDVYQEYLDYNNKYLISYNAFAKDSLIAFHKNVSQTELSEINTLDGEIAKLTNTRAAVSGLKAKYYSFGGFGAAGVIVLTLIICLSRNRAINQAESQINSNRERLKSLIKPGTDAGMTAGTVAFSKDTLAANMQSLNAIIEFANQQPDRKIFQKEITAMEQVVAKWSNTTS